MTEKLNIVIPMAGFGTRLRPHTWSKPKPLVSAAGKAVLGHVLDSLQSAPNAEHAEITFILGYLGAQVEGFMAREYPQTKTHYVYQQELLGQSHAIAQAREFITGPTLILFVDTLVDADYAFLADEEADAVIWVKEVDDPRRFGVVELGADGWVNGLIEKPDSLDNNLAIVGIYYFKRGEDLMQAIDEQIAGKLQTKNEYFLADAIGLMIKQGLKLRAKEVDLWLDAGLPESVLESNRTLLGRGYDNPEQHPAGNVIHSPVFIHPDAKVTDSEIGPHVTIAAGAVIASSTLMDAVIESGAEIHNSKLSDSIVGERAKVSEYSGSLNIGDDSEVSGA